MRVVYFCYLTVALRGMGNRAKEREVSYTHHYRLSFTFFLVFVDSYVA